MANNLCDITDCPDFFENLASAILVGGGGAGSFSESGDTLVFDDGYGNTQDIEFVVGTVTVPTVVPTPSGFQVVLPPDAGFRGYFPFLSRPTSGVVGDSIISPLANGDLRLAMFRWDGSVWVNESRLDRDITLYGSAPNVITIHGGNYDVHNIEFESPVGIANPDVTTSGGGVTVKLPQYASFLGKYTSPSLLPAMSVVGDFAVSKLSPTDPRLTMYRYNGTSWVVVEEIDTSTVMTSAPITIDSTTYPVGTPVMDILDSLNEPDDWDYTTQANGINATVNKQLGGFTFNTGGVSNPVDRYSSIGLNSMLRSVTFACRISPAFPKLIIETPIISTSSARMLLSVEGVGDINGSRQADVSFDVSITYYANVATPPLVTVSQSGSWLDGTVYVTKRPSDNGLTIVIEGASLSGISGMLVHALVGVGQNPYTWTVTQGPAFPVWWGTQPAPTTIVPFSQSRNEFGDVFAQNLTAVGTVTANSFVTTSDPLVKHSAELLSPELAQKVIEQPVGTYHYDEDHSGLFSAGILDARKLREVLPEGMKSLTPISEEDDPESLREARKEIEDLVGAFRNTWKERRSQFDKDWQKSDDDSEEYKSSMELAKARLDEEHELEESALQDKITLIIGNVKKRDIVNLNINLVVASLQVTVQELLKRVEKLEAVGKSKVKP